MFSSNRPLRILFRRLCGSISGINGCGSGQFLWSPKLIGCASAFNPKAKSSNVFMPLYWPKKEIVDGAWKMPGVERVK